MVERINRDSTDIWIQRTKIGVQGPTKRISSNISLQILVGTLKVQPRSKNRPETALH